jgi:hypothetical protein
MSDPVLRAKLYQLGGSKGARPANGYCSDVLQSGAAQSIQPRPRYSPGSGPALGPGSAVLRRIWPGAVPGELSSLSSLAPKRARLVACLGILGIRRA